MADKHFRVVAEKSHGIRSGYGERPINPFHIRNVFDPNLHVRIERRTWEDIPAPSERAARRMFDEACALLQDMRGFKLISIAEVEPGARQEGRETP